MPPVKASAECVDSDDYPPGMILDRVQHRGLAIAREESYRAQESEVLNGIFEYKR